MFQRSRREVKCLPGRVGSDFIPHCESCLNTSNFRWPLPICVTICSVTLPGSRDSIQTRNSFEHTSYVRQLRCSITLKVTFGWLVWNVWRFVVPNYPRLRQNAIFPFRQFRLVLCHRHSMHSQERQLTTRNWFSHVQVPFILGECTGNCHSTWFLLSHSLSLERSMCPHEQQRQTLQKQEAFVWQTTSDVTGLYNESHFDGTFNATFPWLVTDAIGGLCHTQWQCKDSICSGWWKVSAKKSLHAIPIVKHQSQFEKVLHEESNFVEGKR